MTPDEKFSAAVQRMEKRTNRVSAYVVIDPTPRGGHIYTGRVVITHSSDGAGRAHAVAWLPNGHDDRTGYDTARHIGSASGYGYDKATAAMGGASFWNLKTGKPDTLVSQGVRWDDQLRDAGYQVQFAV